MQSMATNINIRFLVAGLLLDKHNIIVPSTIIIVQQTLIVCENYK